MKTLLKDNFDKLMMFFVFVVLLICYLVYMNDTLSSLVRDAFLVLTALLGFRRYNNAPTINAETIETGDINRGDAEQEKETVNFIG